MIKSVIEGETTSGDEIIYSKGEFIFEMQAEIKRNS
jgi:hypothetical protein